MALTIENVEHQGGIAVQARKGGNAAHIIRACPVMIGSFDVVGICSTRVGSSGDAAVEIGTDFVASACKRCAAIYARMLDAQTLPEDTDTTDGSDSAPVRPLTEEDVRDAITASKRGAASRKRAEAVTRERERLTAQRAERAEAREDSAPAPAATVARKRSRRKGEHAPKNGTPLDVAAVQAATVAFYATGGEIPEGVTALPDVRESDADKRAREVAAYYAAGHPVPDEVKSLPDPRVSGSAWSGDAGAAELSVLPCGYGVGEGLPPVDEPDADGITGKCPECRGMIALSDTGMIGKHNVGGVKVAGKAMLTSKSIDAVEHGSVPGDTRDADKRRGRELKGKRAASGPKFKGGADAGKGARDHGHVNGSANTGRASLAPVQPTRGWLAVAGTGTLSMSVRPGVDAGVMGEYCPLCQEWVKTAHANKSRAWRRKHSTAVGKWHAERKEARDAKRASDLQSGKIISSERRKAMRKAASIGSSAEGTIATTGTVFAASVRPEPAPRVGKGRATGK